MCIIDKKIKDSFPADYEKAVLLNISSNTENIVCRFENLSMEIMQSVYLMMKIIMANLIQICLAY